MVVSAEKSVAGICGIVKGAILPGYFGIEAGQSPVGDIFKWFVEGVLGDASLHGQLTDEAAAIKPGQSGLLALDWNNGNRTILVDQLLTGILLAKPLYTTNTEIYRTLIEGTAFGARAIVDRIREYGVPVERIACSGGIAEKNAVLMLIYADVTDYEMHVSRSSQSCALGSAIGAAVVAGAHPDFKTAQAAMTELKEISYKSIAENRTVYQQLYTLYRELHDSFGGLTKSADLGHVMKDLLAIKAQQSPESISDINNVKSLEIWFVTGSQHLYGPEALNKVDQHSNAVVTPLNASGALPHKIVFKPALKSSG